MHKQSLFLVLFPLLLPPSCWFSPSSSSGLLLKTKDEGMHDTNSGLFFPLFLNFVSVCGSRRGRCTRLAVGNFNPDCHVSQLFHLWRHVVSLSKSQITKKKKKVAKYSAACSHNAAPPPLSLSQREEFPASQTVCPLRPPMCHRLGWTRSTVHQRTTPGGLLSKRRAQAPLCPCASKARPHPTSPLPPVSQKQTPNHGISTPNH